MMSNWQGWLYVAAVLIPLAAFAIELIFGRWLKHLNAILATAAIATSFVLSAVGLVSYFAASGGMPAPEHHGESHASEPGGDHAILYERVGLRNDLAALADDPAATIAAWSRGNRRQLLSGVSSATHQPTGQALAGTIHLERPALGVGGVLTATMTVTATGGPASVRFANLPGTAQETEPGHNPEAVDAHSPETVGHGADAPHDQDGATHGAATSHSHPGPVAWTGRWDWTILGGNDTLPPLRIPILVHVDNLTVLMFAMVTFVATLIHLFSIGYMHGDPRYPRFFTYLSLFCFSMLGLVLSGSVFLVFVFWELVGVCSYLLIGFWYEDKKNSDAANKAFITNRVGDVGMLMGLGLLWSAFGTFNIAEINQTIRGDDGLLNVVTTTNRGDVVQLRDRETGDTLTNPVNGLPREITVGLLTLAGLGIFAGCVGKSAQFPLHVWLPDAMAGPTPVSALIHAATMVAAGVYLVGRFFPLFTMDALVYIAYTGGITALIGATIAVVQTDYKKVLAYSTVSQLGFMMLGLGVGGWAAGLFHLITHAFFKALLFLGAGSVYHSVHTYELPALGGLRKKMPITAITMLIATMAISGVPGLSGFYSKDAILASALKFVKDHPEHLLLFVLPVVVATLTAFYMFRMWFLLFSGESRSAHLEPIQHAHGQGHEHGHDLEHGHDHVADDHAHAHSHAHGHGHADPVAHAHESPPIMAWPLIALAIPTVIAGWPLLILPMTGEPLLEGWLAYGAPKPLPDLHHEHLPALLASLVIATIGIGLAILYYGPWPAYRMLSAEKTANALRPLYTFFKNKWYFDELYQALFVRPILDLSRWASTFDKRVIDGVVNGSAWFTVRLSFLEGLFDKLGVDGLVNLVAQITYALGDWGRWLQTGRLRSYLMFLSAAVVLMFLSVFFWIR